VSVVLVSGNVRKAPSRIRLERKGRRGETRVKKKSFLPGAERRGDQQGA
jgi:hypothetical protein